MIHLPDRDLAYFAGAATLRRLRRGGCTGRRYAMANRQAMLDLVLTGLARHLPPFTVPPRR